MGTGAYNQEWVSNQFMVVWQRNRQGCNSLWPGKCVSGGRRKEGLTLCAFLWGLSSASSFSICLTGAGGVVPLESANTKASAGAEHRPPLSFLPKTKGTLPSVTIYLLDCSVQTSLSSFINNYMHLALLGALEINEEQDRQGP